MKNCQCKSLGLLALSMDCCGKASTSKRCQSGAQKRQKLKKQKLQNAADSCVSIKQFIRNIPNTLTETETRQCAEGQQEQQEQEQCQLQQLCDTIQEQPCGQSIIIHEELEKEQTISPDHQDHDFQVSISRDEREHDPSHSSTLEIHKECERES